MKQKYKYLFNLAKYFDNIVTLMNTFKLFLRSLLNNNACVDGGRKKPWYLAVIMFFLSIAVALVPTLALSLKEKPHKNFEGTTYGCREAFTAFSEELNKPEYAESMYVIKGAEKKDRLLVGGTFTEFDHVNQTLTTDEEHPYVDFKFVYDQTIDNAKYAVLKSEKKSIVYFSKDTVMIHIVNPVNGEDLLDINCANAYKNFDEGFKFSSSYKVNAENLTATINDTWGMWLDNIDNLNNATRIRTTWVKVGLFAGIDGAIAIIMALMIWILTRGKRNPYKDMVNMWQAFKITSWTMVAPGILALGLGFLLRNFSTAMFPLLLGIRAMWLSMKSLRPDGTGYAAN